MFKLFALVFAAVLAVAFAEPKPGVVAPGAISTYHGNLHGYAASPLAYSGYAGHLGYAGHVGYGAYPYAAGVRAYGAYPYAAHGHHFGYGAYPYAHHY